MLVQQFGGINFLATQWTFPGCTLATSMYFNFCFLDNFNSWFMFTFFLLHFGLGSCSGGEGGGGVGAHHPWTLSHVYLGPEF